MAIGSHPVGHTEARRARGLHAEGWRHPRGQPWQAGEPRHRGTHHSPMPTMREVRHVGMRVRVLSLLEGYDGEWQLVLGLVNDDLFMKESGAQPTEERAEERA